jgi:hypothetical protein
VLFAGGAFTTARNGLTIGVNASRNRCAPAHGEALAARRHFLHWMPS